MWSVCRFDQTRNDLYPPNSTLLQQPMAVVSPMLNDHSMNAVVRPLQAVDFEKLIRHYGHFEPKESFCGLPPSTWRETEEWLRELNKHQHPQFIVEIGERIVGHAFLELTVDKREAELRLFILQDFRELRLGRTLLLCVLHH